MMMIVYYKHYSAQSDAVKTVWTAFENYVL